MDFVIHEEAPYVKGYIVYVQEMEEVNSSVKEMIFFPSFFLFFFLNKSKSCFLSWRKKKAVSSLWIVACGEYLDAFKNVLSSCLHPKRSDMVWNLGIHVNINSSYARYLSSSTYKLRIRKGIFKFNVKDSSKFLASMKHMMQGQYILTFLGLSHGSSS